MDAHEDVPPPPPPTRSASQPRYSRGYLSDSTAACLNVSGTSSTSSNIWLQAVRAGVIEVGPPPTVGSRATLPARRYNASCATATATTTTTATTATTMATNTTTATTTPTATANDTAATATSTGPGGAVKSQPCPDAATVTSTVTDTIGVVKAQCGLSSSAVAAGTGGDRVGRRNGRRVNDWTSDGGVVQDQAREESQRRREKGTTSCGSGPGGGGNVSSVAAGWEDDGPGGYVTPQGEFLRQGAVGGGGPGGDSPLRREFPRQEAASGDEDGEDDDEEDLDDDEEEDEGWDMSLSKMVSTMSERIRRERWGSSHDAVGNT